MADAKELETVIEKFAEEQGISITEAKIALEFGAIKLQIEAAETVPQLKDAIMFILRKLTQLEHLK